MRYASFRTPGFDPENAFREVARVAFDNVPLQASGLADGHLRALTTLSLADFCLRRAEQQEEAERAKKRGKP